MDQSILSNLEDIHDYFGPEACKALLTLIELRRTG